MDVVIGILAFLFALGLIILVHEGGHFYFARRAKILCREFAFGMGPLVWSKKKGETVFALRALPIGGACVIAGEELESDPLKEKEKVKLLIENGIIKKIYVDIDCPLYNDLPTYHLISYDLFDKEDNGKLFMEINDGTVTKVIPVDRQAMYVFAKKIPLGVNLPKDKQIKKYSTEVQIAPHDRVIGSKSKRARAMVMFGGPLMNFVLAIIIFFIAALFMGFSDLSSTTLTGISTNSPAYIAGLREGDVIYRLQTVDNKLSKDINDWNDITDFMTSYRNDRTITSDIIVNYKRNDQNQAPVTVRPMVSIYSISLIQDIKSDEVKVGPLHKASKAYQAGINEGDIIIKISFNEKDYQINSWKDVYYAFKENIEGSETTIELLDKDNKTHEVKVTPYSAKFFTDTQKMDTVSIAMGISPESKFDLGQSFVYAGSQMYESVATMFITLKWLFASSEVGIGDLSGPVGIFTMTSSAAKNGFGYLLYWIGFLSVNVGFMNLLPIPALDGGRLVFLGYEALTKKRVSAKVETILITVTFFLLMGLMIYVTFNDIMRLIGVR